VILPHGVLVQLAGIVILGVIAQWIAWRLRLPSILLLLAAGIVVGPMTGMIQSDKLFGDLLLPIVSLSIAVILYEGGLNLRFRELRQLEIGGVFFRMTTIAALVSWVIGSAAAYYVVGFRWPVAVLLGAILIVTGPTVIGPMLRHLRLRGRVGALLKWEGILIDPLGATLAVLVYAVVRAREVHDGIAEATATLGEMLVIGVLFGCAAAATLVLVLRRFWIPDSLHNPVSLMLVFASFAAAHAVQNESGLLAVTVMGIVLANQKWVSIRHVMEFKETLAVLLISSLFVTLAARLQPQDLQNLGWESVLFVGVMIFVTRPVSVLAATMGSSLPWRERLFLAWMAPRGIVAAAVASVFALELSANGYPRAIEMVPVTFLLVFVSVLVYGVSAGPLARRLGLVHVNPQGVLFIGAHAWARAMADALRTEGCPVVLIDTDWENICEARMAGLRCLFGSALADSTREEVDFGGLGRLLAVTSNNEVNALACMRYIDDFGRQEVYQLPFPTAKVGRHEVVPLEHRGRFLFGKELTFAGLSEAFGNLPVVKKTRLTDEFDYNAFRYKHADGAIPLFIMKPNGTLQICTVDGPVMPQAGDMLFSVLHNSHHNTPDQAPRLTEGA
jgi:NhaP-type Na+/H+ or K+/H+ antiporter